MANNLFDQAPYALRGENDARLATLEARLLVAETELALINSGAWSTWTPAYFNVTVGNGTVVAKWMRSGRAIHFSYKLTFGSTTALTSTFVLIQLPAAASPSDNLAIGVAHYFESGVASQVGVARLDGSGGYVLPIHDEGSNSGNVGTSWPFVWGTDDVLSIAGTYEAAS